MSVILSNQCKLAKISSIVVYVMRRSTVTGDDRGASARHEKKNPTTIQNSHYLSIGNDRYMLRENNKANNPPTKICDSVKDHVMKIERP